MPPKLPLNYCQRHCDQCPYRSHFCRVHCQCHVIKTKQYQNIICGRHSKAVMFPNQGLFRVTITESIASPKFALNQVSTSGEQESRKISHLTKFIMCSYTEIPFQMKASFLKTATFFVKAPTPFLPPPF